VILDTLKKEILPKVEKPGQYLGLEWGIHNKDWDSVKSRMSIIYPDLYELGMSNFGIKILYNVVNNHPDYMCDRAYGVMPDMEEQMRKHNLGLWGWESYRELNEFDFLGFSLAYELCYTNIFTILDLCKIKFLAEDRNHKDPLIFAGGPAVFNPEPMANYFDFYIIGDGEELITEVQDTLIEVKKDFLAKNPIIKDAILELGTSGDLAFRELKNYPLEESQSKALRKEYLLALSKLQGIYVPQFYEPDPEENYLPKPKFEGLQYPVNKRITQNLEDFNQPVAGPVPTIKTVQDKQVLEIRRGCDRGCRFCQVGYTYLPVRERSPEDLYRKAAESIEKSGYEDLTLLSLSASDYTCLTEAARAINNEHADSGISVNMPSQRADRFNVHLADEMSQSRKSGMTFAPEAGTEKMRKIINKGLSQEEIFRAIKGTYQKGWNTIKLYFMVGLPFEDDSDLDGILDILSWAMNMSKELHKENPGRFNKRLKLNVTISTFIPKSFTAFQWFSQCSRDEFHRKQDYLKQGLYERNLHRDVKLNCTEPELALIEAVLSRADRRFGDVVKSIWDAGSRMDSWSEYFSLGRWQAAAQKHGFDLDEEATKERIPGSKQPWDAVSIGFTDNFLLHEWNQAVNVLETIPCTENKCHACGVCFNLDVKNIVAENLSVANPFVTEIDKEKRKNSCANFEKLYRSEDGFKTQKEIILADDNTKEEIVVSKQSKRPTVVVKHTVAKQLLQIKIAKHAEFKYIGHLDLQKLFERALRRTGLPVVHSVGFNQRMKISWGVALPLFFESDGEYLEMELAERYENLDQLKDLINRQLPPQAQIQEIKEINSKKDELINSIIEAGYSAVLKTDMKIDQAMIDELMARDTIEITKLGKVRGQRKREKIVNIRPRILGIKLINDKELHLRLEKMQRPDEVVNQLLPGQIWDFKRISQLLEKKRELAQSV
jgi:radical SAM-linked protein